MAMLKNRRDAGRQLGEILRRTHEAGADALVLGLPRGGVPVAWEIANALKVPLDVWIVRKLGMPGHEEYAMGALAYGGHEYLDEAVLDRMGIGDEALAKVRRQEQRELERRNHLFRADRPPPRIAGRHVILVDDGVATGASTRAALMAMRAAGAARITLAVPVGPPGVIRMLEAEADEVVCPHQPEPFHGVGLWYEDFEQTGDDEVRALLAEQPWVRVEAPADDEC